MGNFSRSKYKAKRTEVDGITFDSKAEAEFYQYLRFLERKSKGQLEIISMQPKVYLTEAKILYKPDFLIREINDLVYIDVKGMTTPVFNLKARLWVHYGAGLLRLVKKKGRDFEIIKEIYTKNPDKAGVIL